MGSLRMRCLVRLNVRSFDRWHAGTHTEEEKEGEGHEEDDDAVCLSVCLLDKSSSCFV